MYELFSGCDETQLFDAILEVFRKQLAKNPLMVACKWDELVEALRPLAKQDGWTPPVQEHFGNLKHHHRHAVHTLDGLKLSSAAWRFVALGYGYPSFADGSGAIRVVRLTLTKLGQQVCSRTPEDNPSRPGYLERLRPANPKIEDEVFERLIDAANCLEFGLHRPAIVMLGIAAEVTTVWAYKAMKTAGLITKSKDVEFKDQLDAIRENIDHLQQPPDEKHRLSMAFDAIESLRVLRNNAAHHGNPPPDPYLAQERFGSACFHLPVVWQLLIVPQLP